MTINTHDYIDHNTDDYVLHEFGHVFDAKNGVTNNPVYRQIILSEMGTFNSAIAAYYYDKTHFTTVQEMFAELFAAYLDPDGVFMGHEKLAAAPNSVKIIDDFFKVGGYEKPASQLSNLYKKLEYGKSNVIKSLDVVEDNAETEDKLQRIKKYLAKRNMKKKETTSSSDSLDNSEDTSNREDEDTDKEEKQDSDNKTKVQTGRQRNRSSVQKNKE